MLYLDDDLKYELIIRLHSLLTRYLASYCISSTAHEKYSHTDYFKYIKSIPHVRLCFDSNIFSFHIHVIYIKVGR